MVMLDGLTRDRGEIDLPAISVTPYISSEGLPLTMYQAYEIAEQQVLIWDSAAYVYHVGAEIDISGEEPYPEIWLFEFMARHNGFLVLFRRIYTYRLDVNPSTGEIIAATGYRWSQETWHAPFPPLDITRFEIRPEEAMQIAQENGGSSFLETYQNVQVVLGGSASNNWRVWYSVDDAPDLVIDIDGLSGTILEIH
jgi:hypothetical protein